MKQKEKWAIEYCEKAGEKCMGGNCPVSKAFLEGFAFAKEKMMDLCDAEKSIVTFTEINRLGEKNVP